MYEQTPIVGGASGVATYRLTASGRTSLIRKELALDEVGVRKDLLEEAARISWLADQGVPGPTVVDVGVDVGGTRQFLVMTEVTGRSGAEPWPEEQRAGVVDAMADALRTLHRLDVATCPFDHGLDAVLALPGAEALAADRPDVEEAVVCHGDYCVPNVLFDPDTLALTGFIDLGGLGVADPYMDISHAVMSIGSDELNPQYDEAMVGRFLARYGADPSDPRLDFYLRVDGLFG